MYPTNQYMDPYYSHFRNHTPYSYYPPPGWEAGHPRAMDTSYRPPSYGPWPYNAGVHYPHPPEFHCCCNHSYPPGYYGFRPPFPQELPPSHLYYHGPFPQHSNEYSPYFVRPNSYPVDQTPYDYKFKSHCCGCPNHVCHGVEKSNVKIEEERLDGKPERELKDADDSSIIRQPNSQYPVIWLPSGNTEGKGNGKHHELPPQLLNGWVPVSTERADDRKQQGQDGQKEKQFQWPIVWMLAGYDEPKQKAKDLKEKDENPNITEGTPSSPKIKIIPLSWFEDQKPAAKTCSRDHSDKLVVDTTEHRDGEAVEGDHKTTSVVPRRGNDERKPAIENYKTSPDFPEREMDAKKVATYRTIPVMTQKENDEKQPVVSANKGEKKVSSAEKQGENGKEKGKHTESATAKHSKLPPVCLRVDPLPRKKSGNGSSRSPSPPTRKDVDRAKKDMKETQKQNLEPKESDTKENTTVSGMKEKSPEELKKEMGCNNEIVPAVSKHSEEEEFAMSNDHQKVQARGTSLHAQENAGANTKRGGAQENADAETLKGGGKSTSRDSETFRANLSEADAAVRIQSVYRGYNVRRWQPLDKLRKISNVHEQMQGVRKQLQSFEASANKPTEKERAATGEAIMNLLLKLDTIQGLHSCVREARKSVARELICLQEKLDSLCKQPSGGFNNTNEDERLDRAESVIHSTAPTSTAEASDKEQVAVLLNEAKETPPGNNLELCDVVQSEVNMAVGQGTDPSKPKNQKEKSCTSTMDAPCEEEKAAEQVEFQGASTTDLVLLEHPHDNHERQVEESHAGSLEANGEDKKVAVGDKGQEMPLINSMGPLHDATSSRQETCMASTGRSLHAEEANTVVSPAVTGDIKATTATESESLGYRVAACDDDSAEDQTREAVDVERLELKHYVPRAEENSDIIIEDPIVYLKDAEPHKRDPTTAAECNLDEQQAQAGNLNMQEQVADSRENSTKEPDGTSENLNMQEQVADSRENSTKEPDGTSETSMDYTEPVAFEEPAHAALLESTSEFRSAPEQTVPEESKYAMQSELSSKDEPLHVSQKNEVLELTGGETNVLRSNHSLAEVAITELNSSESSCVREEVTTGYERPEMKVSLKNQIAEPSEGVHRSCVETQASKTDELSATPKEAPSGVTGANSVEGDDAPMSETEERTGVASAEVEVDNLKEDVGVQIESKASEEASPASVTLDAVKDTQKNLADENQKLRMLLQKLLASGNNQTEVITDLSEKVKVLERKLARKKKPKVRVHRPARNATAKVH